MLVSDDDKCGARREDCTIAKEDSERTILYRQAGKVNPENSGIEAVEDHLLLDLKH